MRRGGLALVAAVLGVAGVLAVAATAQAAYTWAGTWNSTFGPIYMDANGAGSYPDHSGTLSGGVSGLDGRTNSGTWDQPTKSGTYEFNMSEPGKGFTGTYEDTGGGCVFPPCTWDGTCTAGACLGNGPDPPPACDEGSVFGCRWAVPFGFDTRRGSPAKPPADELPRKLLSVQAETDGARLLSMERNPLFGEWHATGSLIMRTVYREPGPGSDRRRIDFGVYPPGNHESTPGEEVKVTARLQVDHSTDPNCPMGVYGRMKLEARKRDSGDKVLKLTIDSVPNRDGDLIPCLFDRPLGELVWKTDDFRSFRIGRPTRIGTT